MTSPQTLPPRNTRPEGVAPVRPRGGHGRGDHTEPTPIPSPPIDSSLAATWRYDLGAGLVVFLVALPLCLGIALASGAPLFSGIITGVVGGLLVSRLSGSSLMVSGPAAGLTAIVIAAIAQLGSFQTFLVAVVLAGVIQLVLGAVRAGIIAYFVPSPVIRGMLAGIGLILILKQLPYAFGVGVEVFEADSFAEPQGGNTFTAIPQAIASAVPAAVALALASLALLAFWPRLVPKSVSKLVPAPLAAVLVGVLGNLLLGAVAPQYALSGSTLVSLPVPTSFDDVKGLLTFPNWGALSNPDVYRVALTVALVASLETLLSLEATDKLDPYKRTSPANRELMAQGAGNMLSGLVGGLPMTGVIVRSAANIGAGGRTWRSSWIHGLFLAVAVLSVPMLLNHIPLAVLAAILIHTGFKLAHPKVALDAWRRGMRCFAPFAVTVVTILTTDLLIGIAVGLTVATFFILRDSYRNAYSWERHESADHQHVRLTLAEEVTFLNKAQINSALTALPPSTVVTVDGTRSKHLDDDVVELLHDFRETATAKGIALRLVGIPAAAGGPSGH